MMMHRFLSRTSLRTRLRSGRLLSFLCGLLLLLMLPTASFASTSINRFTFGSSEGMDLASVSVVRLIVSYGSGTSTLSQAACSVTGLGAIVGSWRASNSGAAAYSDWVLTDDSLVNPGGSPCAASSSNQALNTIAIYANSAYTGNLSAFPLAMLKCQELQCEENGGNTQPIICQLPAGNTCASGTLLIPFTSSVPLPFIDMTSSAPSNIPAATATTTSAESAASSSQQVFGVALTAATSTASSPSSSATGTAATPTIAPTGSMATPTINQALEFLTPLQVLPSTNGAISGEMGMPIVNSSGQLVNMVTQATDPGTAIFSFVTTRLAPLQNGHTNPLHNAWNQGINDFYGGRQSSVTRDFQPILALNPQFQASTTFQRQNGLLPGNGDLRKTTSKSGTATPTTSRINAVNIPLSSLSLTWIALGAIVVLVILLLLITFVFLRRRAAIRQKRKLEMQHAVSEAESQASVAAPQEQAQSELQPLQRLPISDEPTVPFANHPAATVPSQVAPEGELRCPACGSLVKVGDNFCSQCRAPLPQPETAGTPVSGPLSPPAQMSPVLSPSASIADMPTVEMSPAAFSNGQGNENQDSEATLPFMMERRAGRNVKLVVGTRSDPGIKRKLRPNEDSLFAGLGTYAQGQQVQQFGLFVVADGMGGHANGQDASRLAIQTIEERLVPKLEQAGGLRDEEYLRLLIEGVQSANLAVHQRNMEQHGDMGTTMTAAFVVGTKAYITNVGDSRTYLYREAEGLQKITNDHSVVASLVEAKIINAEDIYTHPKRNQIYRSLGEKPTVEVDGFSVQLQPGDKLLLCSDGLWDMTRDPIIQHILKTIPDPEQSRNALIQAAKDGGGEDNISVIVVEVTEDSQQRGVNGFHILARPETPIWPPDPEQNTEAM
jgi:serine/threonine protein phosphatase PrpC